MTFYNIFSKKREKTESKIKVIIDYREKNSLVPSELLKLDFEIEFSQLKIGDYLINDLVFERKTVEDLKSSIINKRIFNQMKEIKQYSSYFLIVEGHTEKLFDNKTLNENALRGFIISAQTKFKIPLLFSMNEKETAKYIEIIIKRKNNKNISINPKKISLNKEEQKRYILESFPNIGPVKARKLLEKFNSLQNIFNAKEKDLKEILGNNFKYFYELVR